MRALVAGCEGQVARALVAGVLAEDRQVTTLEPPEPALTAHESIAAAMATAAPDLVVNAAPSWTAQFDFETWLEQTLRCYLAHEASCGPIRARRYAGERPGVASAAPAKPGLFSARLP